MDARDKPGHDGEDGRHIGAKQSFVADGRHIGAKQSFVASPDHDEKDYDGRLRLCAKGLAFSRSAIRTGVPGSSKYWRNEFTR